MKNPYNIITHINGKPLQKTYRVEIIQTEVFTIDVTARDQGDAIEKAVEMWNAGDYKETGKNNITIGDITIIKP